MYYTIVHSDPSFRISGLDANKKRTIGAGQASGSVKRCGSCKRFRGEEARVNLSVGGAGSVGCACAACRSCCERCALHLHHIAPASYNFQPKVLVRACCAGARAAWCPRRWVRELSASWITAPTVTTDVTPRQAAVLASAWHTLCMPCHGYGDGDGAPTGHRQETAGYAQVSDVLTFLCLVPCCCHFNWIGASVVY